MGFYELFWYFCIYAVLGWCMEVCFCTINTGKFVNRGFLNGPVCPIYGFGMIIILAALLPLQHNLLVLFLGAMLLTSLLELVTGFVLKKVFHTSWWDYSDTPFNLGGYICLKFSLAWGACAVLVVRVLHPLIAGAVALVPRVVGWVLMPLVAGLFLADAIVTVCAIAKLNKNLGGISEVAKRLHEGSDVLAKNLGDTALAVDGKLDSAKQALDERADALKAGLDERTDALKDELDERADALKTVLAGKTNAVHARLLRAFPNMKSDKNPEALSTLRDWYNKK